jgi:alpha-N-acetylglucosamine transferase
MKNYVVCLKFGSKYSPEYVNKLHSMVSRHLTIDHEFVCITEDATGIDPTIKTIPLTTDSNVAIGWWYKIDLFNKDFPLKGVLLFLDLDIVIFNNIDKLFDYNSDNFTISRNFHKGHKCIMNSSCFRFETGTQSDIYENFIKNKSSIMKKYAGDQDYLNARLSDYKLFPDKWMCSYKWEMMDKQPELETSVAVFHGNPNPHQINNEWIKEHWR